MNSKQIFVGLAGVLIAGVLIAMQAGKNGPGPLPPDPTPVVDGIAQITANDIGTFAFGEADNWLACAAKIDSSEFKTTDQAFKWLDDANEKMKFKAFEPTRTAVQKSVEQGLPALSAALKEGAPGFKAAIKGQ